MGNTVAQPRLQTTLLIVFSALAVTLAIIGVYGVMAGETAGETAR